MAREDRYGIKRVRERRDKEGQSEKRQGRLQTKLDARKEMRSEAGRNASGSEIAANYDASAAGDADFGRADRKYLKSRGASREEIKAAKQATRMAGQATVPAPTPTPAPNNAPAPIAVEPAPARNSSSSAAFFNKISSIEYIGSKHMLLLV